MPLPEKILEQINELDPHAREELVFELFERFPFPPTGYRWFSRRYADESPSIVQTPNVCGGAARLIRTRIPVWTLERMRQLGFTEADILKSYPTLKALDLVEAWAYVACHRNEIEHAIRENEED